MNKKKWLLYVEDPGAVNFFAPLVQALRRQKIAHEICACGHAVKLLKKRDIAPRRYRRSRSHGLVKNSSLVVVGTSENVNTPAFEFVDLARRMGIPTAAIVDSAANADFRFRGRSHSALSHAPNHLLVPDSWTRREYQRIGYPRSQVSVVGRPLSDPRTSGYQHNLLNAKIQSAKKERRQVIVFVSEVSTGLNAVQYKKNKSYDLQGRGKSILRTEIVVEEFLDAIKKACKEKAPPPFLVLRRHPKEKSNELKELAKEFDAISSSEDPIELVQQADLVVGMSSILLEEAYYLGCRVLIVLPRAREKEWLEIARKEMVFWTSQRSALIKHLRSALDMKRLRKKVSKQCAHKSLIVSPIQKIIRHLIRIEKC